MSRRLYSVLDRLRSRGWRYVMVIDLTSYAPKRQQHARPAARREGAVHE